ncbi:DUF1811 family protein [Shimazuella alba]|uniref:DUF1811 family protein n=1 Tax=Shimazuella alba TaxID=2690964 RepID=A0A6I4VW03_9BACL|nr:DUF1811 family protein [Shimazuella alba]
MKRYSQMTPEELTSSIKELEKELIEAKKNKLESNAAILKQKINLAKAYLIDPQTIQLELKYEIEGESGLFQVEYLNGIYAWGTFNGKIEKEAFPLSLLKPIDEN